MFGLTTSQSIAVILLVCTIVFYFAANTGIKQNAFLYIFIITLTVLIVDFLFMNDRTFQYQPHYQNWQKRRQAESQA